MNHQRKISECEGKDALTRSVAKKVASRLRVKGIRGDFYKCTACGQWHVGSNTLTKRQRARR